MVFIFHGFSYFWSTVSEYIQWQILEKELENIPLHSILSGVIKSHTVVAPSHPDVNHPLVQCVRTVDSMPNSH